MEEVVCCVLSLRDGALDFENLGAYLSAFTTPGTRETIARTAIGRLTPQEHVCVEPDCTTRAAFVVALLYKPAGNCALSAANINAIAAHPRLLEFVFRVQASLVPSAPVAASQRAPMYAMEQLLVKGAFCECKSKRHVCPACSVRSAYNSLSPLLQEYVTSSFSNVRNLAEFGYVLRGLVQVKLESDVLSLMRQCDTTNRRKKLCETNVFRFVLRKQLCVVETEITWSSGLARAALARLYECGLLAAYFCNMPPSVWALIDRAETEIRQTELSYMIESVL